MTLSRKGSRPITVDGNAYRWRLRGRPTYDQGMGWAPCTYAVARPERGGTTLLVTTDHPHPTAWFAGEVRPVLPGEVADTIRQALARGWQPDVDGPQFRLDLSSEVPAHT